MQKAEAQHKHTQSQPTVRQSKGASLESAQSEQIAQLEAMIDSSPQAARLAQFSAMVNNSPQVLAQRRMIDSIHNSPRMAAQRKVADAIHNSSHIAAQRRQLDGIVGKTAQREEMEEPLQPKVAQREEAEELMQPKAIQRKEEEEPIQGKFEAASSAQLKEEAVKPNNTGLPDNLKSGIESLSGMSMDNVRVHYNSSQPAQLNALAYAQGTDIHVAPGQEQHLPHEAWHVVQQAQGRVQPTMQMKEGVPVNDDKSLEHEADVMGARAISVGAVQAKTESGEVGEKNKCSAYDVAQMVLATVNPQNGPVNLTQVGGGVHFVVMENGGQPNGNDVSNAVGFTGVLNANDWAGLGKSPKDYWRAHGYANSFGGAGDITNVGWWAASAEETWTEHEQMVRGAGLAQIDNWLPGTGETGTYFVDRKMHPQVLFKARYVADLMKAVTWGFDDGRDAWTRALATCDSIFPVKEREKRVALLKGAKGAARLAANGHITAWVNNLFGVAGNTLEGNLIESMTMTYNITANGVGAGVARKDLTKKVTSGKPNPAEFGLQDKPQDIWEQLVNADIGVFAQGNSPAALMRANVPYDDLRKPAQVLSSHLDGFGV